MLTLSAIVVAWAVHSAVVIGGRRPVETTVPSPGPAFADRDLIAVRAVMHIHTRASWDGTGTVAELTGAARSLGIPVVFLDEHNNTHAWDDAGFRNGVLIVPGTEVSLREGHELVWGAPRAGLDFVDALPDSVRTASVDSLVAATGAFAAVAHPRGGRKPWKGAFPRSASGVEIVNGDVAWRDDSAYELIRALAFYPFDPAASLASLVDTPRPALAYWDSLLAVRFVSGLAGLDAHGGVRSGRFSIRFPSYDAIMPLASQHIWITGALSGDPDEATAQLLTALHAGHDFAAFDCFGNADGFAAWATSAGATAIPGDAIPFAAGAMIHARIPRDPRVIVRLIENARVIAEAGGWEPEFAVKEPGCYRLEVYQRRHGPFGESLTLPWIFSNPIVVSPS